MFGTIYSENVKVHSDVMLVDIVYRLMLLMIIYTHTILTSILPRLL